MTKTQRRTVLRVISAYRAAPTEALNLADSPPIDLLIKEPKFIHENGREYKEIAKKNIFEAWARYRGWCKVTIPNLRRKWIERHWGQVDFYFTQAATGHSVFGSSPQRIGKQRTDVC